MESIREVRVNVKVDTNKSTYTEEVVWGEYDGSETLADFIARVGEKIRAKVKRARQ